VTPGNKENAVDIRQNHQPHKSGDVDAFRPDWRRIERRLVDFFRSNGVEIEHDGGESYIVARVRMDIKDPAYECTVKRTKPRDYLNADYISLSKLVRAFVEAVS
jgi:hypothetical protein